MTQPKGLVRLSAVSISRFEANPITGLVHPFKINKYAWSIFVPNRAGMHSTKVSLFFLMICFLSVLERFHWFIRFSVGFIFTKSLIHKFNIWTTQVHHVRDRRIENGWHQTGVADAVEATRYVAGARHSPPAVTTYNLPQLVFLPSHGLLTPSAPDQHVPFFLRSCFLSGSLLNSVET